MVAIPLLLGQAGLLSMQAGRPLAGAPAGYVIVPTWRDLAALQAFVGAH